MREGPLEIDGAFPGGNIVVEGIARGDDGDTVLLRQDLRDTEGDWFYWCFRVRGAGGRRLRFRFTGSDVIGVRGPAASERAGESGAREWRWLGRERVEGQTFAYDFPEGAGEVRFGLGMTYTGADLERFLAGHARELASGRLERSELCRSRKGRSVPLLRTGRLDGSAPVRVLVQCRHHACEMMASYELEGLIDAALAEDDAGRWLRANVEMLVVPFMDADGVEDGDQGKNRRPHDHNRDYGGEPVHTEVNAVRDLVPGWSDGRLRLALDLHCPWIRGVNNEWVYIVGSRHADVWERQLGLARAIEEERAGPVPFLAANCLPFGESWNVDAGDGLVSSGSWLVTLFGRPVAATIELPYANARGAEVTAASARSFGRDLARAVARFLDRG